MAAIGINWAASKRGPNALVSVSYRQSQQSAAKPPAATVNRRVVGSNSLPEFAGPQGRPIAPCVSQVIPRLEDGASGRGETWPRCNDWRPSSRTQPTPPYPQRKPEGKPRRSRQVARVRALHMYCEAYATYIEVTKLIRLEGLTYVADGGDATSKMKRPHPALTIQNESERKMRSFMECFGMSAGSRSRIKVDRPATPPTLLRSLWKANEL